MWAKVESRWKPRKKYGVVVQHGTQSRSECQHRRSARSDSSRQVRQAEDLLRLLLQAARQHWVSSRSRRLRRTWTGICGEARRSIDQYHGNFVHYNWHWFWKTGNGDLNNQGTHQLDVARWALDTDQTHPVRAMAIGGRFQWNDQGETPNTMFGIAEYPNGQFVFFNVRNVNYDGYERQVENEYYFEDGGKIIRGKYYPEGQPSRARKSDCRMAR